MRDVLISRNEVVRLIRATTLAIDKCNAKNVKAKEIMADVRELIESIAKSAEKIEPNEGGPLAFEQIFDEVVYIEYKDKTEIEAAMFIPDDRTYAGMVRYNQIGTSNRYYVEAALYGSFWRCWERKPTQDERENEPWE